MKKSLLIIVALLSVAATVLIALSCFSTYTVTGISNEYLGDYTISLLPNNKYTAKLSSHTQSGSYKTVKCADDTVTYYFYDNDGNISFTAVASDNGLKTDRMNFIKTSLF